MVRDGELRGERRGAGEGGVLPRDVLGFGAEQHEQVEDARFRHPVRVHARLRAGVEIRRRRLIFRTHDSELFLFFAFVLESKHFIIP